MCKSRVQKCRHSMYSMSNIGMCYPGLNFSSKMHLFRSVCQPTLMYGVECLNISSKRVNILNWGEACVWVECTCYAHRLITNVYHRLVIILRNQHCRYVIVYVLKILQLVIYVCILLKCIFLRVYGSQVH